MLFFLIVGVYGVPSHTSYYSIIPRSIGILQPMILFFAIIISRLGVKYLLIDSYSLRKTFNNKKRFVLIGLRSALPPIEIFECDLLLTSNLVSHSLGLNDSNVIDDSLVEVEILGQPKQK